MDELRIITGANLNGTPTEAEEIANAEEIARVWGRWMSAMTAWVIKPDGEDVAWSARAIVKLIAGLRDADASDEKVHDITKAYQERRPEMWAVVVDLLEMGE